MTNTQHPTPNTQYPIPNTHTQPVTAVIVSFNTRDLLRACLDSLRRCRTPLDVVVVDNASRDGSAALVAADYPEVTLLALQQNLGFAAANNLALRQVLAQPDAAGRSVLLLNPDTVVHAEAIERMAAFLDQHRRVGVVGPRLLNPDGSLQRAAFRFPTLAMTALDLFPPGEVLPGRLYDSWWQGRYPQEPTACAPFAIDHPLGACMLVRVAALLQVGLFDEQFFMYSEEVDLCYRIRRAGWAIWQLPSAQVTHVGGAATAQFRQAMFVELQRSRLLFAAKHRGPRYLRAQQTILGLGLLRLLLLAWWCYARGTLALAELRARLLAYGAVWRLFR